MYTITNIGPMTPQEFVTCLQCGKPVIVQPGIAFEVKDETSLRQGYVHALCEPQWKQQSAQE